MAVLVAVAVAVYSPGASAFSLAPRPVATTVMLWAHTTTTKNNNNENNNRRSVLNQALLLVASGYSWSGASPSAAAAASPTDNGDGGGVDYSRIQDLLGPGGDFATQYAPSTNKRPTWLTEPTDEFKQNEAKSLEFKRKNILLVQQFKAVLDQIGTIPTDDPDRLARAIDSLRRLIATNKGLPTGITKDDVVKICRRRKAKKYWPTEVEIAYVCMI